MFISKLESPESRGNHSLTSKCRFKNPQIHELCYVMEFKTRASSVLVSVFLADLDKNYRNEIEMDKNNSVHYMEYIISKFILSRK